MATKKQVDDFLAKIKPMVQADMAKTQILASLTAAQAILESGYGLSGLTQKSNNLFGIKGSYNGNYVSYPTKEWDGEKYVSITAKFKKYASWAESIADHSNLFWRLERYANLIGETNYIEAAKKVSLDGYATSPTYAQSLINLIEQYKLYEWDVIANIKFYKIDIQNVTKGDADTISSLCNKLSLKYTIKERMSLND